jgi:tetratricopeptide (TPR) repeat protein
MIQWSRERRSSHLGTLFLLLAALAVTGIPVAAQQQATSPSESAPSPAEPSIPGEEEAQPTVADLSEAVERIRVGAYDEAEVVLAALQVDFPDDPALLLMHGEVLLALGRSEEALEVLRRGAEEAPERPRMNFQLGTALASSGQREPALDAFAREIEVNEDPEVRVLARLNRSLLLQQERRWGEAAEELEAVLILQPERSNVYGDLATLYIQAGDAEAAVSALERGREAGFASAVHYYSLGARLYKDEMFEQAAVMLSEALRVDPTMAEAERSLAASLERLGREAEALDHLRRYLELRPDAPDADIVSDKLRAAEEAGK